MGKNNYKNKAVRYLYQALPLSGRIHLDASQQYCTLALKRSGQHAIINWICSHIEKSYHINDCSFIRQGFSLVPTSAECRLNIYDLSSIERKQFQSPCSLVDFLSTVDGESSLVFSFESYPLNDKNINRFVKATQPKLVLILRDPYNWLASALKQGKKSIRQLNQEKKILIGYLEQALGIKTTIDYPTVVIDYGKWVSSEPYRRKVALALGFCFSEEIDTRSRQHIPSFGGGSSFEGVSVDLEALSKKVFERWKEFQGNEDYHHFFDDGYLEKLSTQFFDIEKPF